MMPTYTHLDLSTRSSLFPTSTIPANSSTTTISHVLSQHNDLDFQIFPNKDMMVNFFLGHIYI